MELLLQVKLLRAIETRRFSAVGDTALKEFRGKLPDCLPPIAIWREEIRLRHFREDPVLPAVRRPDPYAARWRNSI